MSDRIRQVNDHLRTTIGTIISQEIEVPLGCFVTISRVETSRDLKRARVFVTIIPDAEAESTLTFLRRKGVEIQGFLGRKIHMKFTPKLQFVLDEQLAKAQVVYDLIDRSDV
jgi:ribosome-binding factor A